ncbi:hypothetical protein CYMTET_54235 [Cymbomonas tetramitiformis]|uniref:Uncharacterized protein n=1 Tax=Cymbomonas tetramitiformis TaxID=36881 RepID=A0AAE0BGT3_9CHLO|nr:hypothetical protein CYMTET_54235 [Cymbomonas tetramitiformis]
MQLCGAPFRPAGRLQTINRSMKSRTRCSLQPYSNETPCYRNVWSSPRRAARGSKRREPRTRQNNITSDHTDARAARSSHILLASPHVGVATSSPAVSSSPVVTHGRPEPVEMQAARQRIAGMELEMEEALGELNRTLERQESGMAQLQAEIMYRANLEDNLWNELEEAQSELVSLRKENMNMAMEKRHELDELLEVRNELTALKAERNTYMAQAAQESAEALQALQARFDARQAEAERMASAAQRAQTEQLNEAQLELAKLRWQLNSRTDEEQAMRDESANVLQVQFDTLKKEMTTTLDQQAKRLQYLEAVYQESQIELATLRSEKAQRAGLHTQQQRDTSLHNWP